MAFTGTRVLCTHNMNPPCRIPSFSAFIHWKCMYLWWQHMSLAQLIFGFIPIIKWYLPFALFVLLACSRILKNLGRITWMHEWKKTLALGLSPACYLLAPSSGNDPPPPHWWDSPNLMALLRNVNRKNTRHTFWCEIWCNFVQRRLTWVNACVYLCVCVCVCMCQSRG